MREKRTKQLIYRNFISLHLHREISQNSKYLKNAQKKDHTDLAVFIF